MKKAVTMTQQEALKELENLTIDYGKRTEEEIERLDEAVDMAIEALNHTADISKKVMKEN